MVERSRRLLELGCGLGVVSIAAGLSMIGLITPSVKGTAMTA